MAEEFGEIQLQTTVRENENSYLNLTVKNISQKTDENSEINKTFETYDS